MSKIITYAELNVALDVIGIFDDVINIRFAHDGTNEQLELIFESDPNLVRLYTEHIYKCNDCLLEWGEPGLLVVPNCKACASENIEYLREQRIKS